MRVSKKAVVVAAASAIVLAGTGTALAYWSTTGSGTGSAVTSAGASNLTVTQTSTLSGLAPGVAAKTISGTVTNNAPNNAFVNTVTVAIASVTGGAGACSAADYELLTPVMTIGRDLAPGATANFTGATLAFHNDPAAVQDGCKGATVNLSYASN